MRNVSKDLILTFRLVNCLTGSSNKNMNNLDLRVLRFHPRWICGKFLPVVWWGRPSIQLFESIGHFYPSRRNKSARPECSGSHHPGGGVLHKTSSPGLKKLYISAEYVREFISFKIAYFVLIIGKFVGVNSYDVHVGITSLLTDLL